ncbi:MAG: PQQ-binding-like beta-propeller repeat protein [Armatimonadetes bacterium]|nr:PQQ-binding-like beta-propeller repeat protein [Armatimonadota bacterium]
MLLTVAVTALTSACRAPAPEGAQTDLRREQPGPWPSAGGEKRLPFAQRPGHDWPTVRGDLRGTGASDEAILPPLRIVWEAAPTRDYLSDPIVHEGRVYVAASGRLYALDGEDGRCLWDADVGAYDREMPRTAAAAGAGRVCYEAVDETWAVLSVFDTEHGKRSWQRRYAVTARYTMFRTPPLILEDGRVCHVAFEDGRWNIVARRLANGSVVWRTPLPTVPAHLGPFSGGTLYASVATPGHGEDAFLLALDSATGRVLWQRKRPALGTADVPPFMALEAVSAGWQVYGSVSGRAAAFDVRHRRWAWVARPEYDYSVYATPVTLTAGLLIVAEPGVSSTNLGGPYRAYDVIGGRLVWQTSLSRLGGDFQSGRAGAPVAAGHILYAFGEGGIVAADVYTGDRLWSSMVRGEMNPPFIGTGEQLPAVSRGRIFVALGNQAIAFEGHTSQSRGGSHER